MKYALKAPLKISDRTTISELNFRDHTTAGDYLAFDRFGGVAQRIALIASMSGTDEELIKRLSGADYRACEKIIDNLLIADEQAANPPKEGESAEKKPGAPASAS